MLSTAKRHDPFASWTALGINFNNVNDLTKLELVPPYFKLEVCEMASQFSRQGIKIFGTPIGHEDFVRTQLTARRIDHPRHS